MPDFMLPAKNLLVEIKGKFPARDREKMRLVLEQNNDIDLVLIRSRDEMMTFIDGYLA